MDKDIVNILKKNNLRVTVHRVSMLNQFIKSHFALTYKELYFNLDCSIDEATIYRTIQKFIQKGIIHKIPSKERCSRYALSENNFASNNCPASSHIHFKCRKCGKVFCLNSKYNLDFNVPKGFKSEEINIIANGLCELCN